MDLTELLDNRKRAKIVVKLFIALIVLSSAVQLSTFICDIYSDSINDNPNALSSERVTVVVVRLLIGFVGLALASLMAAFMSTISTHINWGASYITNDFYYR